MTESMQNGVFRRNNTTPPADNGVMSLFSLKGKTAVISGAGGGIGFAVAKAFAEAGANVAIWYNTNKEAIEKAAGVETAFNVKCNKDEPDKSPFLSMLRLKVAALY
jgi:sorbose reductase